MHLHDRIDDDYHLVKRLTIEPFAAALRVSEHDLRRTLHVTRAPIPYRTRPGSGMGSRRYYDLLPVLEWCERAIHGGLKAAQAQQLVESSMTFAEFAEMDDFNKDFK